MPKIPVRNRHTKKYDKTFLFQVEDALLNDIKAVAESNHMSISAFLRQSAARNIDLYKKHFSIRG